jgi:uncharacterized protein YlbG (UPF0298 family)
LRQYTAVVYLKANKKEKQINKCLRQYTAVVYLKANKKEK